jgi:predicted ArsR family transcriptional regulator
MATTTRSRILEYVRKNQVASANELSSILGKTGANIRYHLSILISNEFLEIVGKRKDHRGRPVKLYGLTRHLRGEGLDNLAGVLMDTWLTGQAEKEKEKRLRSIAHKLAGTTINFPIKSIPGQMKQAVSRLDELNYHARWEAGAAGPRIILGNCPYAAIIADHPELCRMDAYLLEEMLEKSFTQTEKLRPSVRSLPFCAFKVTGD